MDIYKTKVITDKEIWEGFILSQNPKSFLQSWNWGETNILLKKEVVRLGFYRKNTLVGAAQIIFEKARRGWHFLIPGGPILDWNDKGLGKFVTQSIKNLAKAKGAWFVRIRPELLEGPENKKRLRALGFIPAPMHLHAENTWILDLTALPDKILSRMRKSTRYSVRKSLGAGLVVEKTTDPKKSVVLYNLQKETVRRLKFIGFSKKLFEAQMEIFGKSKEATLYICKKGKEAVVASLVIFYGKYAYYHQSASTSRFRELYPSYFVQWNIILDAKKRGMTSYDMWGAAPKNRRKHRFFGPSLFKEGFGCDRVDYIHASDMIISPLYIFSYIFEILRRLIRNL